MPAIITPALLAILQCPVTGQPLREAPPEILARLRARTEDTGGALTSALVTADGQRAYPVRDGIPVLLSEEAVAM